MANKNVSIKDLPNADKMDMERGPRGVDEVHAPEAIEAQKAANAHLPQFQPEELSQEIANRGHAVRQAVALAPDSEALSARAQRFNMIFGDQRVASWRTIPDLMRTHDRVLIADQITFCQLLILNLDAERNNSLLFNRDNKAMIDLIDEQIAAEMGNIKTLQQWHREALFDGPLTPPGDAT